MQSSNQPAKFRTPFAQQDGAKAEIPVTTTDATRASQALGFPPLTGQPPEAGGVPPQLPDMNGFLNMGSRVSWWSFLGGRWAYDSDFATSTEINGYPRGAALMSADFSGEWLSTVNDNTADPDTSGAGWVPGYHYGQTLLSNLTGGNLTLTPTQAAKPVLRITGALTSNLVITVPAWIRDWTVYNGTSGAFTVSLRTAGRPAVVIPRATAPSAVRGDGTDVAVTTFDVPVGSTTVAGTVRLATPAETISGSSQALAVTPFGFNTALSAYQIPASQITSGTLALARLPNLPASQITSGTLALARLPNLPASQITSETFALGRIPSLPASQITSGTLALARLPDLPASQITSGTLPVTRGGTGSTNWGAGQFLVGADAGTGEIGSLNATTVRTRIGARAISDGAFTTDISVLKGNAAVYVGASAPNGGLANYGEDGTGSVGVFSNHVGGKIVLRPNGRASSVGQVVVFDNGNVTTSGAIYPTGGYDTGSSRTIKHDIEPLPYGLAEVLALDPMRYRYRPEYREDQSAVLGFIAEDVQALLREPVRETPDAASPLSLQADQLVPVLWRAVQQLAARVDALEGR